MKKQWLLLPVLLLFVLLLLACEAPPSSAGNTPSGDPSSGGGASLPLTDGTFVYKEITVGETVTGYAVAGLENETVTELVIPATHNGLPVSRIAANAFQNKSAITSATIPATVTEIGESALRGCVGLETVTFAEESCLRVIGSNAFTSCKALREIILPETVRRIYDFAFLGCSSLKTVRMTGTLDGLGTAVFMRCTALEDVTLAKVKKLPSQTFAECTSLTAIWLDNTEEIGEAAFSGCTALTVFVITDVKHIAANAFSGCTSLKEVKHVKKLEEIGGEAFSGCTSLRYLELPMSLRKLGAGAFQNCTGLLSVTVPSGLTTMGAGAFGGCASLRTIALPFTGEHSVNAWDQSHFSYAFGGRKSIPRSLTTVILNGNYPIADRAFEDCDGIMYLEIPQGVMSIGQNAFAGCTRLVLVRNESGLSLNGLPELPDQQIFQNVMAGQIVTEGDYVLYFYKNEVYLMAYIGEETVLDLRDLDITAVYAYAFYGNKGLRSVILPEGAMSIGEKAFGYCTALEQIELPLTLMRIGKDAFVGCNALSTVGIPDLVAWCGITFDNIDANPLRNSKATLLVDGETVRELILPDTVDRISAFAFSGYRLLERVTIGANVKEIGKFAFYECSGLQAFRFEDAVGWSSDEKAISVAELTDFETVMLHISKTYYKTPWTKE